MKEHLSFSSLKRLLVCPRWFKLAWDEKEPEIPSSPEAEKGKAIHRDIESFIQQEFRSIIGNPKTLPKPQDIYPRLKSFLEELTPLKIYTEYEVRIPLQIDGVKEWLLILDLLVLTQSGEQIIIDHKTGYGDHTDQLNFYKRLTNATKIFIYRVANDKIEEVKDEGKEIDVSEIEKAFKNSLANPLPKPGPWCEHCDYAVSCLQNITCFADKFIVSSAISRRLRDFVLDSCDNSFHGSASDVIVEELETNLIENSQELVFRILNAGRLDLLAVRNTEKNRPELEKLGAKFKKGVRKEIRIVPRERFSLWDED